MDLSGIKPGSCLSIRGLYLQKSKKKLQKEQKNLLPVQIAQYFQVRNFEQNRYSLRSRQTAVVQIEQRTSYGNKSIQKRGRNLWLKIPEDIRNVDSHLFFKKTFKAFLLSSWINEISINFRNDLINTFFLFLSFLSKNTLSRLRLPDMSLKLDYDFITGLEPLCCLATGF